MGNIFHCLLCHSNHCSYCRNNCQKTNSFQFGLQHCYFATLELCFIDLLYSIGFPISMANLLFGSNLCLANTPWRPNQRRCLAWTCLIDFCYSSHSFLFASHWF